jgi:tripartite-type tricarboxylate transporter receptor subunit TctC
MHARQIPTLAASRRTLLRWGLACTVPLPAAFAAPDAPLRLLVPAPAGGTTDLVARALGDAVRSGTGMAVLVDNKPGASGALAAAALLAAPRDGATLLLAPNSLVTEVPHTVASRYDPFDDFIPLAEIASSALVLVANPALPVASVEAMVAWVRARPGAVSYASYGAGTLSHIKGLQFCKAAAIDMQHVAYSGSPPALQDVIGGHVPFMFDGVATSLAHVRAGRLKALAVTSGQRTALLPEVPTLAELGYPALTQAIAITLFAPAGTPQAWAVARREQALAALRTASVQQALAAAGLDVARGDRPTQALRLRLRSEYDQAGEALRAVGYQKPS